MTKIDDASWREDEFILCPKCRNFYNIRLNWVCNICYPPEKVENIDKIIDKVKEDFETANGK